MIGLSTYGYNWRMHESAEQPMTLLELVGETERLDLRLLQICDYPQIESFTDAELDEVKRAGDAAGIRFELGTRGVDRPKLMTYLDLATKLEATYLRTMLGDIDSEEARIRAIASLEETLPDFVDRGVTIAIETHELVATSDLRYVIEAIDSPNLGVCLDPGNSVARLELPHEVVSTLAPYTVGIHVKDFLFARNEGSMGFLLVGCPLGDGLLDYEHMIAQVRPESKGVNQIIEHWVPWLGSSADTCRMEQRWTEHNLRVLRSK